MIASNKVFRSILITGVGLVVYYQLFNGVDHETAFDFIPDGIVAFISIIVFGWTIFVDRKEYSKGKNKAHFLPTVIGITILVGCLITFYILDLRDKSPIKIHCEPETMD